MTIDGIGNVIIAGYSVGIGTGRDMLVVKYDGNGNELWEDKYDSGASIEEDVRDVCTDADNNVYATGNFTTKYNSDGGRLWISSASGSSVRVDKYNNIYIIGSKLIKLNVNGEIQWYKNYSYGGYLAVDKDGYVYVATIGTGNSYDFLTLKYDGDGNLIWTRRYNGDGNNTDQPMGIRLDSDGSPYVFGPSIGFSNFDIAAVKYAADGGEQWAVRYSKDIGSYSEPTAVVLDLAGNLCIAGKVDGETSGPDIVTVKYDKNGNRLWSSFYNGPGNSLDLGAGIAVDVYLNVFVCGVSRGLDTNADYVIIKYDKDGHEQWVSRYNGATSNEDSPAAIAVNAAGDVYITGTSRGQPVANASRIVTIKIPH
jgi:hypothetical protein